MNNQLRKTIERDYENILNARQTSSYTFRTRVERAIARLTAIAIEESSAELLQKCDKLKNKMVQISDQSNQTSDGTLRSYICIEEDLIDLFSLVIKH